MSTPSRYDQAGDILFSRYRAMVDSLVEEILEDPERFSEVNPFSTVSNYLEDSARSLDAVVRLIDHIEAVDPNRVAPSQHSLVFRADAGKSEFDLFVEWLQEKPGVTVNVVVRSKRDGLIVFYRNCR